MISISDIKPSVYKITNDKNIQWIKGRKSNLTITCDGDLSNYKGTQIDGVLIGEPDLTVMKGSTILTFKASYLESLSPGKHTLKLIYTDGSVQAEFTVLKATDSGVPDTGDRSQLWLWICAGILSAVDLFVCIVMIMKRKRSVL